MIVKRLLETIYPPVCESCGDAYFKGDVPYLCDQCFKDKLTPIVPSYCEVCGQSYPAQMPDGMRCGNCNNRHLSFDFAVGAYQAEGEIMDWMHRFKYSNEIHFARMFGQLMTQVWQDRRLSAEDDWIVVPVPLHRKRLRERGFNQSSEIARQWVRHAPDGINLKLMNLLRRKRHTTRQATLDRHERLTNLKDAFALSRLVAPDQNFILVDDVVTTGTTASECAAILYDNLKPNKISVISVLRG